jgi:hypothetical protein
MNKTNINDKLSTNIYCKLGIGNFITFDIYTIVGRFIWDDINGHVLNRNLDLNNLI